MTELEYLNRVESIQNIELLSDDDVNKIVDELLECIGNDGHLYKYRK